MRDLVRRIDDEVDAAFDRLRGRRSVDRIFYTASSLGEFGLLWVMLALLRALRGGRTNERAAVRTIAGVILESLIVNAGLKTLFARERPAVEVEHPHPFRQPLTSSFPSGHATAGYCAATLLSEQDPLGPLYFATAAVVAASRIHTKIHHASDVVGGIGIGTCLGLIGRRLAPLGRKRPS